MLIHVGDMAVDLIEKIGDGGTGEVFRGEARPSREGVALKVLHAKYADIPEFRRRYEREAQALAHLKHPAFVRCYGTGELQDGRPFLALEFVSGDQATSLQSRVPKAPDDVLRLFIDAANAFHEAHEAGVVHRDVKPENLIVERKGHGERLRILDLGFVRFDDKHQATDLTAMGTVLGTLGFMPIEQLQGKPIDRRADIYALAVCVYETWCGELPVHARTPQELFRAQTNEALVPLHERVPHDPVAKKLWPALHRALRRDRDVRTATMQEFANDLAQVLATIPRRSAPPPSRASAPPPRYDSVPPGSHAAVARGTVPPAAPRASSRRMSTATLTLVSFLVGAIVAAVVLGLVLVRAR